LRPIAKSHRRFLVTKNGEAKAIILGVEDFLEATAFFPASLARLQQQAKKHGADKLTLEEIELRLRPYVDPICKAY
jgi:hypothetical protein